MTLKAVCQSIHDICHLQNVLGVNLFREISGVYVFETKLYYKLTHEPKRSGELKSSIYEKAFL